MKLRPYQVEAVDAVRERYRAGDRAVLVTMATGLGKTVVIADVSRRTVERGGRVLILAHRTELLAQAREKLAAHGCDAALEQGPNRAGDAAIVVASIQTLKGKRLAAFARDAFKLVVVDEAHHALAPGYRAVIAHFAAARILGVTATPDRGDAQPLGDVFASCAFRYEMRAAIRDGYLAPIVARRIQLAKVDLSSVKVRAGDLAADQLAAIMAEEKTLHATAIPLLEQSGDRPTIVFAVNVAHAHALAEVLNRYQPGVARAVDGAVPPEERARILAAFRAREFRILVNCALFIEGFDEPSIACVGMARPTMSRALFAQCIGRGTRLSPDTGKRDCLVLDFAGNAGRHSLIGPADVLAGMPLDDLVREEVERLAAAGEELEVDGLLDRAEAEANARHQEHQLTAVAKYAAKEIDPFIAVQGDPVVPWDRMVATEAQRAALTDAGLKNLPEFLGRAEAARWLETIEARRVAGLATLPQVRLLTRAKFPDPQRLTKAEASKAISVVLSTRLRKRIRERMIGADLAAPQERE